MPKQTPDNGKGKMKKVETESKNVSGDTGKKTKGFFSKKQGKETEPPKEGDAKSNGCFPKRKTASDEKANIVKKETNVGKKEKKNPDKSGQNEVNKKENGKGHILKKDGKDSKKKETKKDEKDSKTKKADNQKNKPKKKTEKKEKQKALAEMVTNRHLEMEPLCCLSSCLIRTGSFGLGYVEIAGIGVGVGLALTRILHHPLWPPLEVAPLPLLLHPICSYIFILYNTLWLIVVVLLMRGIRLFYSPFLKIHFGFGLVTVLGSIVGLAISIYAAAAFPQDLLWREIPFILLFTVLILVQTWGLLIIKDCLEFFSLLTIMTGNIAGPKVH